MPGHVVSGYVNQNTPGDLIFDKNDTLVSIQTQFTHAYVYRCNAKAASCTNIATFDLQGGSLYGALNPSNTNIQVTDYVRVRSTSTRIPRLYTSTVTATALCRTTAFRASFRRADA